MPRGGTGIPGERKFIIKTTGNMRVFLTTHSGGSIIATGCTKMKKLRSIEELARLAGVSKSTVSRALNDSPLISKETTARIKALAEEHRFRPSASASRLSLQASKTIGFVTHPITADALSVCDIFSIELMSAVAKALYARGYDLLMVQVGPRDADWVEQYLHSGKVDGFILMSSDRKRKHIEYLLQMGAPFVATGRGGGRFSSVCGDDYQGGRIATEHLLSTGRRKIVFVGGPEIETEVAERFRGYADALREAEIAVNHDLVAYGDFTEASAVQSIENVMDREEFDAVFANSDLMAIAVMERLRRGGIRVPDDVAVVGYDDVSIAARSVPPLTTVSQNIPTIGRLLTRDLLSYLDNRVITETTVPVELVKRESA